MSVVATKTVAYNSARGWSLTSSCGSSTEFKFTATQSLPARGVTQIMIKPSRQCWTRPSLLFGDESSSLLARITFVDLFSIFCCLFLLYCLIILLSCCPIVLYFSVLLSFCSIVLFHHSSDLLLSYFLNDVIIMRADHHVCSKSKNDLAQSLPHLQL